MTTTTTTFRTELNRTRRVRAVCEEEIRALLDMQNALLRLLRLTDEDVDGAYGIQVRDQIRRMMERVDELNRTIEDAKNVQRELLARVQES